MDCALAGLHRCYTVQSAAAQASAAPLQSSPTPQSRPVHDESDERSSSSFDTSSPSLQQLRSLVDSSRRILCLTGAGISTESSIPDYRSPGRPPYKPITHQQFASSHRSRQRYWARSLIGYRRMREARPNAGHFALAHGMRHAVHRIVTQNVDDLHEQAGCPPDRVLHLHGSIHTVKCADCKRVTPRADMQHRLEQMNVDYTNYVERLLHATQKQDRLLQRTAAAARMIAPPNQESDLKQVLITDEAVLADAIVAQTSKDSQQPFSDLIGSEIGQSLPMIERPDGDLELSTDAYYDSMGYPSCTHCGGMLWPNVVFFGGGVSQADHALADEWLNESDALLCVGTSLTVWSAFRIVKAALKKQESQRFQIGILNDGATRADNIINVKHRGRTGETLQYLFVKR